MELLGLSPLIELRPDSPDCGLERHVMLRREAQAVLAVDSALLSPEFLLLQLLKGHDVLTLLLQDQPVHFALQLQLHLLLVNY